MSALALGALSSALGAALLVFATLNSLAVGQWCPSVRFPYPNPHLGPGRPPRKIANGTNSVGPFPVVYEGVIGDAGWDGKPGSAELVLLSPKLASWRYLRNLHNGAYYTSPAGFQGMFPLGFSSPPMFQYRWSVTKRIVTTPADCNQTKQGTRVPSFQYGTETGSCCNCFGLKSDTRDVFEMTGQNIYARSTGSGNWAKTSLAGFVNQRGLIEAAGPVFTGGSMYNNTRGRIFSMRRLAVPAVSVSAPKPSKRLSVHVMVSDKIYYAVEFHGKLISDWSTLSLTYKRSQHSRVMVLGDNPSVVKVDRNSYHGTYKMTGATPVSHLDESYNEALISFKKGYAVRVRVYNDGFAVRFELALGGMIYVVDEDINFMFAKPKVHMYGTKGMADYALFGDPFYSDGEDPVIPRMLDDISPFMPEYNLINNPQLFVDDDRTFFLTAFDAVPRNYPRAFLMRTPTAALGFRTVFDRVNKLDKLFWGVQSGGRRDFTAKEKEDYIAFTKGTRALPWRGFGVVRTATQQAEMLLALKLAPNPDPRVDYSWVPGHVHSTWDWGNHFLYRDPKTKKVTAEELPTTRLYKAHIDFAAKHGIEYVNIDEGWNFPTEAHFKAVEKSLDPLVRKQFRITGKFDSASGNNVPFKSPFSPNFDMKAVVDYGKSKGVGVIVWVVRYALIPGYYLNEAVVEDGYKQMQRWGAAGLKIDSGAANDQKAIDGYHFVARKCAQYRLLCLWHGPSLQGQSRTYPHFLAAESADTGESRKFGFGLGTAVQHMMLPLLRNPMNPIDYQIGLTTNLPRSPATEARVRPLFWTWEDPLAGSTRTHEMALTVVLWSGINYIYDAYFRYEDLSKSRDPGDRAFVRIMTSHPGNWDESVWLEAHVPAELKFFKDDVHRPFSPEAMPRSRSAINQAAIVARRKGSAWWVAGITGWAGYRGRLRIMRFLQPGVLYSCIMYADDVKQSKPANKYTQAEYQRIRVSSRKMRRGDILDIAMAPAGGWMMTCEVA